MNNYYFRYNTSMLWYQLTPPTTYCLSAAVLLTMMISLQTRRFPHSLNFPTH